MSMTITLDGSNLTVEKLVAIARFNEKVELAPAALERIKACRAMLEDKLAKKRSCTAQTPASASSLKKY
jgi:histidine ammonia-lyase